MSADFEILPPTIEVSSTPSGFRFGQYLLLIKSTIFKKTAKGRCVILRFRVLVSQAVEEVVEPNAVGSDCSVVINFDGEKAKSADFRIKLFICGLFGASLNSVSTQTLSETASDLFREKDELIDGRVKFANPARGFLIGLNALPDPRYGIRFDWISAMDQNSADAPTKRIEALALSGDLTSESNAEKALFLAFLTQSILSWRDGYVLLQGTTWEVVPQYEELAYRLDFAIFYPKGKVAVEVDGHEWHERTKEQAARDKQRDRELQTAGWFVLRFTGSEVFKDADACVTEVRKFIRERVGP